MDFPRRKGVEVPLYSLALLLRGCHTRHVGHLLPDPHQLYRLQDQVHSGRGKTTLQSNSLFYPRFITKTRSNQDLESNPWLVGIPRVITKTTKYLELNPRFVGIPKSYAHDYQDSSVFKRHSLLTCRYTLTYPRLGVKL